MIDQRLLPGREVIRTYRDYRGVAEAIRTMVIRGAPAIGVAAAMGVALGIKGFSGERARIRFALVAKTLKATRPTAVNLAWAVARMGQVLDENLSLDAPHLFRRMREEALAVYEQDLAACRALGRIGAALLGTPARWRRLVTERRSAWCGRRARTARRLAYSPTRHAHSSRAHASPHGSFT